jgi:hypothetical protein
MLNFNIPTVADKYVLVSLESKFPPATKQSAKAKAAMVADMVAKGATPEQAEKQAHGHLGLFPDGELKDIKTPFYAFDTYLRRVTIRWLGGNGAARLLSIKKLDALESKFNESQLKVLPLWEAFKASYPAKLAQLEAGGGDYFDITAYPSVDMLDRYFKFELTVQPIADPDAFTMGGLTEKQAADMKQRLADAMTQAAADASREYAKKLVEQLDKISRGMVAQKVDGKHTRYSPASLRNLQDLIEADLNISQDQNMAAALTDVKRAATDAENAIKSKRESDKYAAASSASQAAKKLAGLF